MPELRPPPQCQPRFGAANAATTHICPYQQQLMASWHVKRPKYLSCPQLLSTQRLGSPFSPQCAQAAEAVVTYDQCSAHDMATLSGGTEELGDNELQYRRGKQCQESQFGREHSASEAQYLVTGPREPAEQRQRRKWLWAGPPHVQSATPTDSAYSEPLQGGSVQQQARIASRESTATADNAACHMNAGAQPHAAGGTRSQPLPEVAVQQRMLGVPALKVEKVSLNGHRDRLATNRWVALATALHNWTCP